MSPCDLMDIYYTIFTDVHVLQVCISACVYVCVYVLCVLRVGLHFVKLFLMPSFNL